MHTLRGKFFGGPLDGEWHRFNAEHEFVDAITLPPIIMDSPDAVSTTFKLKRTLHRYRVEPTASWSPTQGDDECRLTYTGIV